MNDSEDFDSVDTSAEEAAVAEAEEQVDWLENEVAELKEVLEQAQQIQEKCEERAELAKETLSTLQQQKENFEFEQSAHLRELEDMIANAEARFVAAENALQEYLATNPPAAKFEKWLNWTPSEKQVVPPNIIHDRLNLSTEQQNLFAKYLYDRDTSFRSKINNYREQYKSARGSAEKLAVTIQARRGGTGDFAEKLVAHAFRPLGNISTQNRTAFADGHFTKTDLFVSDLKTPAIFGKGQGLGAPIGGSVAIEVKTGRKDYIYSQLPHMVFQAGGHQKANASMTVCSRDIKELSPEKELEIRNKLKDAGSPIIGTLPSKNELDSAVLRLVTQTGD